MIKNILWDFDGVILDSMKVRDWGFVKIFKSFDAKKVDMLLDYHRKNGGLSRYVKIRYFFENILNRSIREEEILKYATHFSELMRKELTNPENLILDALDFIKLNYKKYQFHIVSGSDQNELRFLCKELNIAHFFHTINGSPTPKKDLVETLLKNYNYNNNETILIGDSINDYDAAEHNSIDFYGYNNSDLKEFSLLYIHNFINMSF
jgi:HAD superfamily hydrolase (TIGR01549 family)